MQRSTVASASRMAARSSASCLEALACRVIPTVSAVANIATTASAMRTSANMKPCCCLPFRIKVKASILSVPDRLPISVVIGMSMLSATNVTMTAKKKTVSGMTAPRSNRRVRLKRES